MPQITTCMRSQLTHLRLQSSCEVHDATNSNLRHFRRNLRQFILFHFYKNRLTHVLLILFILFFIKKLSYSCFTHFFHFIFHKKIVLPAVLLSFFLHLLIYLESNYPSSPLIFGVSIFLLYLVLFREVITLCFL